MESDCFNCEFRKVLPGSAHIACMNPDPEMVGDSYGIKHGWFAYPINFDPVWMVKRCSNFKPKDKNGDVIFIINANCKLHGEQNDQEKPE